MNTIILAGGYAERLWPLTENYPKTLLKIAGKPALYHLLENIVRIPDLTRLIIAVDKEKESFFIDAIESNNLNIDFRIRPKLSIHDANKNGKIKGPIQKLKEIIEAAKKFSLDSNDFLIVGGDNVFGFELNRFYSFYKSTGKSCIAIHKYFEPTNLSQFGVPTVDEHGHVTDFMEKPIERSYKLASTACYLLQRETVEKVLSYFDSEKEDSLGEFISWLITKTELVGYQFQEEWYDIGTREGILSANRYLMGHFASKKNEPELAQGQIEIIPPIYIERHVTISDSTIGPNVFIGTGSKIIKSRVENSIIYENAKVQNSNLRNSIVGSDSITEGNISEAVFGPHTKLIREDATGK